MILIIIKIINEQQLTTTMNHEPWTMNHEHFFSDGGLTPHCFFHIHFFEKKVLPFFASFVNPLVFTRWRTFGCYSATWMNNNKNFIKQQHWTMNIFSVMVVLPLTFFHIHFFEKKVLPFFVSFVNPLVFTRWKGPPGLHRGGGQGVPKNHRTMLGDSFSGTAGG